MSDDINSAETEEHNQIFKGLKFFLSGKLRDGIEDLLVKNGGEKIEYFSDYVKICIVGDDPLETDLTDAKEIYEVPAVNQDWVTFSLHYKKQLEPKAFEIDNVLFKDVVLHCTQLSEDDTFAVLSLLFFNGGTFEKDIESRKITHLLCNAASGPKYEFVIRYRPNIKLVTPDWFMLSVQQKQLLDVTEYHPRLLIVPKPPPSPKPQQDLGDLSSITGFDDVDLPTSGGTEAPLSSGPDHPNLQQLKQRFPWMSPASSPGPAPAKHNQSPHLSGAPSTPVATSVAMSSVMSQLRPPLSVPGPNPTSHHQIIMTQSAPQGGGLPSQLKINVPSAVSSGGLSHLTDPMQQRIYVQQHLSQQQKQLLMQQHQKQQLLQQQQQQQQQGVQLNVQWSRGHPDGVIQQQQQQQQRQVLQQGQIIQRGQQIIQQTSQGQQIIQQTSQSQQIIQQGQPIIQQTSQGQQIIQQTSQGQQIIQQNGQQIIQSQQMIQQGQQIIQQQSGSQQQLISPHQQQQQQQPGGQSQQIIQQTQQIIQQGPGGPQQIVQGGRIIAEHVIQQGRVIQEQVIQQGRVQLPPDQILAQGRVIQQQDPQGSSQQSGAQSGGPLQMQQIIFRGRDGQQHILQQHYPPGSSQQGGVSQQGGQQQQWHFTQVRQTGPPAPPGQQQIVIQQQNQQHVLQQQQQQQNQQQQNQQQQILLQQQLSQQGQAGQGQQIFIQQPGNQQRTTNWTLVQQHQIPPRGQVLKLNARAHQQLQNMTPQEKSNFLSRLQQRHIIMQMQQGQRPAGAIIRNVGPGQQIATVIRHPTTGNWVQAPPGQINPQQQQQQQIILQQQQTGSSSPQVRVSGPVQHVLQGHKQGAGQTFTWNPATGGTPGSAPQTVESGPGGVPTQVVQQVGAGGVSMELIQLKQRQQMAKLLQQQQQLVQQQQQQQAKPSTTPLYNQVMEQTQAAAQSLTTPDLVSAHPSSDLNDASAAGQLRLMTAHHQAQLQSSHPVSSTQLYQSAQPSVVGGVPQQVLSQAQSVVTPPRLSQQMVTSSLVTSSSRAGGGHSAAQRVAAVLAKSAAGQSVSAQHQQQMQHQQRAQFYGHNPNIKLPPEKCLLGCVFLIVEYDKQPEEADQVDTWRQIILQNGGEVESSYVLRLTHILCLSQKHPLVHQGLRDGKRCITAHWLNDVVTRQHVLPPHLAIHFPTPFSDEKPCRSHYICATGFEKEERDRVRWMIEAIGAKYCSYYNSRIDFLVARKLEGDKVKKAKELQRPIVNVQWLNEVMFGHYACIQQHDGQKYQQYNLSHPFRIDYSLVLHLMGPWKVPINVSQEAYDRVKSSPGALVGPRRKKIKLSLPSEGGDTEDGENCELSGLTLDPLPYENKPRILLSGFAKPEVEEKIIRQLGAEVATSWRDASHLVLATTCAGRTLKFLCAISRVNHVVNGAWLRASLQACHLLDEAEYTVKTIVVPHNASSAAGTVKTEPDDTRMEDVQVKSEPGTDPPPRIVCDIPAVLARGELRLRLFAGKTFYLSPSISPSPSAMREMIQAAGGTVERQRRSWSKIPQDCMIGGFVPEKATYLVVTCHKDLNLVADLLKHDYGIFNTEFVMTSIMTQKLDFSFVARRSDLERPREL